MKHLFLSNSRTRLLDLLEEGLFTEQGFPLRKKFVVIPHRRVKDLLMEHFAMKRNSAVGLQFFTLHGLIEYFLSLEENEIVKFPREGILALHLEEAIQKHLGEEPFLPLDHYLDGDLKKIPDLARALAKAFKTYDLHNLACKSPWQTILWDEMFSFWPSLSQKSFQKSPPFPAEVHIFQISAIPPAMKKALEAIEKAWETSFYLFSPSEYYWGDLSTDRERVSLQKYFQKKGVQAEECDALDRYVRNRNPLLANLVSSGTDLFTYFLDRGIPFEEIYEPSPPTLLGSIQNDFLELVNPEERDSLLNCEKAGISLHSSPSKLREVEILYNNMMELFYKNPHLSPREIGVFAPKIAPYFPHIQMVFGSKESQLPHFAVTDLPIPEHILKNLSTIEPFDLFQLPEFQEKFSLKEEDIDHWKQWRGRETGLVMNLAMPLKDLPFIEPSKIPLLETFLSVSELLQKDLDTIQKMVMPLHSWVLFLREFIERYLVLDNKGFSTYLEDLKALPFEEKPFPFSFIERYIEEFFETPSYTHRSSPNPPLFFSDLNESSVVGFKHIFLLGMDEENFPSPIQESSLCPLPTSPTDEDRFTFLGLILSSAESLTISYQNIHPKDGKMLGPSLLVKQLFAYLDHYYRIEHELPSTKCLFDHPSTSLHPIYFSEEGAIRSYSEKEYRLAKKLYSEAPTTSRGVQKKIEPTTIWSIDELSRLHHPLRFYAQNVLGIYLKEIQPEEEFLLPFLERYRWKQKLQDKSSHEVLQEFFHTTSIRQPLFQKMAMNELKREFDKIEEFLEQEAWSREPLKKITFHRDCKRPYQQSENHSVHPPLVINEKWSIVGSITPNSFSLSKTIPKEVIKQWPTLLIINYLGLEPKIFFPEVGKVESISIENPKERLISFLSYGEKLYESPCPFLPDWLDILGDREEWRKKYETSEDLYVQFFQPMPLFENWGEILREVYTK